MHVVSSWKSQWLCMLLLLQGAVRRPGVLTHVLAEQSNGVGLHTSPDSVFSPVGTNSSALTMSICLIHFVLPCCHCCRCCFLQVVPPAQPSQWSACAPVPTARTSRFTGMDTFVPARVYSQLPANCPWGSTAVCQRLRQGLPWSAVSGVGLEWCCLLPCIVHPRRVSRVWSPGLCGWLGPTGPNVGELPLSSMAIWLPHPVYHIRQRSTRAAPSALSLPWSTGNKGSSTAAAPSGT
jgi:hypothetical protein